jgi:hypothetical protein
VIFEAKTLGPRAELARVRGAVAQLLEYRFLYGEPADRLCLVTNQPVSDKRVRFLAFLGIAVVVVERGRLVPGSPNARTALDGLLDPPDVTVPGGRRVSGLPGYGRARVLGSRDSAQSRALAAVARCAKQLKVASRVRPAHGERDRPGAVVIMRGRGSGERGLPIAR